MTTPELPELICEVCEKNKAIGVASSWLGAFSSAYCRECAESGAEPYWAILATGSMGRLGSFADFVPAFQDTVMATLQVTGRTLDDYWRDLEKSIEEEQEFWDKQLEAELEAGNISQEEYDEHHS